MSGKPQFISLISPLQSQRNRQTINCGAVADLTDEVVSELIGTNLLAPIALARHLLPSMIERRSGLIVFIDSIGGYIALPTAAVYTATKFSLRGFAGSLRREVMEHGIKVSIISPGFVSTRLTDEVNEAVKKLHLPMISPERIAKIIVRTIERPRRENYRWRHAAVRMPAARRGASATITSSTS
jgi:short-subunit dehydrogenase